MNTLKDYQQQALTTAMPEAFQKDYLIPSIVGEVGELFGKRGKAVRDHWTEERLRRELAAEYGDITWMAAVLLHVESVNTVPKKYASTPLAKDPWYDLLDLSNWLYEEYSQSVPPPSLRKPASILWQSLENNCQRITGYSFDLVLAGNITKLRSRQERGVLTGSGDAR